MRELHSFIVNLGAHCTMFVYISKPLYFSFTNTQSLSLYFFCRFNVRWYFHILYYQEYRRENFGLVSQWESKIHSGYPFITTLLFYILFFEMGNQCIFTHTHTHCCCFFVCLKLEWTLYAYCIALNLGSKVINKLYICVWTNTISYQSILCQIIATYTKENWRNCENGGKREKKREIKKVTPSWVYKGVSNGNAANEKIM